MIRKTLSAEQSNDLIAVLKKRFEKNMHRHKNQKWSDIQAKLEENIEKLWSLNEMEKTGGEPDIVDLELFMEELIFCDCSSESPSGRRSLCYDGEALKSRKEFAPQNNVVDMAAEMGIELMSEEQYRALQKVENFDTKTSSWLKTPDKIRKSGGAIFGDFRYGNVFVYHNGAQSYYAARGFRGLLKI